MDNSKFKNLYESFVGQIDYCNVIETYGEDFVDFTNTNFNLLQAHFCGFYLTLLLDEYLIKLSEKEYTTEFVPEFIKGIVRIIAVDNGSGYTVGDLSYRDEVSVLVKIRHKLAHGDFVIKGNEIVFEENNTEGRLNLDLLKKALYNFDDCYEDYFLTKPRKKVFNCSKLPNRFISIDTKEDFDKLCSNVYRVEITDTPISKSGRNIEYITLMRYLYEKVVELIKQNKSDKIPEIIAKGRLLFDQNGINIEYSFKKLTTVECYNVIKQKYMADFDSYKMLPAGLQLNLVNNISYRINKGEFQKFNIRKGILLNLYLLDKFKANPDHTLKKVVDDNIDINNLFIYHIDDVVISSYLVAFNSIYEYGLDKESTINGHANFIKIYDEKQLDFSLLNLDNLNDPNMTIEHNCDHFDDDVIKFENDSIDKIDRTIANKEDILKNYLKNCKNQNTLKINTLINDLEDARQIKEDLLSKIEDIKIFLHTYDKEKYTRNLNIIYHIRNAIAHGNIFIDSYSNDVQKTSLIIRDFYDGKVCYERKIKVIEFAELFSVSNIKVIHDFIVENIEDKSIVLDDYLDILDARLILRNNNYTKKI